MYVAYMYCIIPTLLFANFFCTTIPTYFNCFFYTCFHNIFWSLSIKNTSAVVGAEGCGHFADSQSHASWGTPEYVCT